MSACDELPPLLLLDGIAQFNRREYFEQHETLERLWRAEDRQVRHLYQGILQIGVAFHHLRRLNHHGTVYMLTRGMGYLAPFAPRCQSVDVAALIADAAAALMEVERLGKDRLAEFDWTFAPTVRLHPVQSKDIPLLIDFAAPTSLYREDDRVSTLPIIGNGPPGTFVIFANGRRVSLPTDQIVFVDDADGHARVGFGGMRLVGLEEGRLVFVRIRELLPEDQLSPDRSHKMLLDPQWVARISVDGQPVWPAQ
jgi:predicted metal-dependent hydrolase